MSPSPASDLLKLRKQEEAAHASGNWQELVDALAGQAELLKDTGERAGTLYRAGCAALRADDRDRALELFERVTEGALWPVLARFHRFEILWGRGEWERLCQVIDEEIAAPAWDVKTLRLEKARLLAFRRGVVEEAKAELQAMLGEDPGCREAVWINLVIALRSGDWEGVATWYRKLFELSSDDPAMARSIALRLGQVSEFHLKDLEQARGWYENVGADKAPELCRLSLLEMAEARGDWEQAASQLSEIIKSLESEEKGSLSVMRLLLARVLEDLVNDPERAGAQINTLLQESPDDLSALYSAAESAAEKGEPKVRAELDQRLCRVLQDKKEIAYFMADRFRVLLDDLDDPEGAAQSARAWLESAPDDVSAGRSLIDALVRSEKHQEAIAGIDGEIKRTTDPREIQGLLFLKAELAAHKLGDTNMALESYLKALEIPPSQFPILQSIARLYQRLGDYGNQARALTAAMKLIQDPALRTFYQCRLGELYMNRLGNDDQAFTVYGEILKADPQNYSALKNVALISRRKGSWQNYTGAISRIADTSGDQALKSELKTRVAWIFDTRLNQKQKAAALYQELAKEGNGFAMECLRRFHYQAGDLGSYARLQEALADAAANARLRAGRLVRIGAAREILGELADGWAAYEKARVSLAQNPQLYLPMIDLAQLAGYWTRYVSMLEDLATKTGEEGKSALLWESAWCRAEMPGSSGKIEPESMLRGFLGLAENVGEGQASLRGAWLASVWLKDHSKKSELLARLVKQSPEATGLALRLRLATVLRDDLGASEEAVATFRQVLAKEQKSAPLIRELQLMYQQAGQWGELVRMLLMEVPLRKEPEVQVDIYCRLASLYQKYFKALDEAIKCHQAVLRIVPDRLDSHAELVRLFTAKEKWKELAAALEAFHKVEPDTEKKIKLLIKAADVYDQKLSDADRAINVLKSALDLDPSRDETLHLLEKLYEREKRWEELVEVLISQAGKMEAPADQASLYERVASIRENQLGDQGGAIEHLITARDLDPERRSVLQSLERLFEAAERWEELIDTLERLSARADQEAQVSYLSRVGALWDQKLSNLDNSVSSWERVREIDASNLAAAEALVSLYERTGDTANLVDRMIGLAGLVAGDRDRALDLLCRAGSLVEKKLGDEDRALSIYSQAMEADPSSIRPLGLGRSLRLKREEWAPAIELWLKEEALTQDPGGKLEIFTGVGELLEQKLSDLDRAAKAYERAVAINGEHLPAVVPLSEIYFGQSAFDKARPLFEVRTKTVSQEPAESAAEIWYKTGWCAEQAQDIAAAMSRYHSSVEAAAGHRGSLERLSELYAVQEKWQEASAFTERLIEVEKAAKDAEALFVSHSRLGMVEIKLSRLDRATTAYESALALKPGDYETLSHLVDLYKLQEQWKKAILAYDHLIRSAPSQEAAAEGLVGKGIVLEDELSEEESALAHFRKAVEVVTTHLVGWERLSRIFLRRKSWQEAEQALSRLLELDQEPKHQVENHYNLGKVYAEGLDDLSRAAAQFEAALKIDKVHVPAMEALGDIYLQQEEWQKFVDSSEAFVKLIPADKQPGLIPHYFKMGEVYRDHLDSKERAIIQYTKITKMEQDNEEARSALTALYVSDPKFADQAKAESINLIRLQPLRAQTYKDLGGLYKSQGNLDAVFWIYSILNLFGDLDYEEELFYEANKNRAVKKTERTLKEVERESLLVHPDERGPQHDMLVVMGEYLQKNFPPPINRFGAKKSNLLTDKSASPIKDLAARVAVNLGIEDLNIYVVTQNIEPQVFHTTPPSLVVNSGYFERFSPEEQVFLMGRILEKLINRHALLEHFPPEKVMGSLAAVAMAADPRIQLKVPGMSEADLDKEVKNARKVLPRKLKSLIEHAAQRFNQEVVEINPAKWKKAAEHTANRAGLIVCNDLPAAFGAIIKTDPKHKGLKYRELADPTPIWEKNEYVVELLAFAVSDPYFRIRERLGFSITK